MKVSGCGGVENCYRVIVFRLLIRIRNTDVRRSKILKGRLAIGFGGDNLPFLDKILD